MPIITLTLTSEILTFVTISALIKICFVSWVFIQYRRKSRCLDDIENMIQLGLAGPKIVTYTRSCHEKISMVVIGIWQSGLGTEF